MAQSLDHPELLYIQAKRYQVGRPDGKPLWIVVHDMEATETPTRAEATAIYFRDLPDDRTVSSHYTADNNSVVQCVRLKDSAYTVGNRPGNNRGINWEYSGFASQTRDQWLDQFGRDMFFQSAWVIRSDAAKYGIPLTRRSVNELKVWKPGVTSHNDLRLAFGGTSHTDPGGNFPWDYYLAVINGEETEDSMDRFFFTTVDSDSVTRYGKGNNVTFFFYEDLAAYNAAKAFDSPVPGPPEFLGLPWSGFVVDPATGLAERGAQVPTPGPVGPPGPPTLVPHTHELAATSGPAVAT